MAQSFRQLLGASPSTATTSDSVLVIIDAQNEYADGLLKVEDVSSTRSAIASLLHKYRSAGPAANVVHVLHDTPEGAPIFTRGKPLSQEFEEIAAREGEKIVHKQHPGSFTGTDLDNFLKVTERNKVVLVGYMVTLTYILACLTLDQANM